MSKKEDRNYLTNQAPPHSKEAEMAVIGGMLQNDRALSIAFEKLSREMFYDEKNGVIFESMRELWSNGKPVDEISIIDWLNIHGQLKKIGGAVYLSQLSDSVPAASSIGYYIEIVKTRYQLREVIKTAHWMIDFVFDNQDSKDVNVILQEAEEAIFQISQNSVETVNMKQATTMLFQELDKRLSQKEKYTGLSTGYEQLDEMIYGLNAGDLITLAANTSRGKTAFALSIAVNIAKRFPVLYFSFEMDTIKLIERVLSRMCNINMRALRSPVELKKQNFKVISDRLSEASQLKLFLDDTRNMTIEAIRQKARISKMKYDIRLIVIDHLQLIVDSPDKSKANRNDSMSHITRGLKNLAGDLNVPIIALSQLNRFNSRRDNDRPVNSDLRDSGAIEQDSDIVGFLYCPDNELEKDVRKMEFIITKHRNGEIGSFNLFFHRKTMEFTEGMRVVGNGNTEEFSEDLAGFASGDFN